MSKFNSSRTLRILSLCAQTSEDSNDMQNAINGTSLTAIGDQVQILTNVEIPREDLERDLPEPIPTYDATLMETKNEATEDMEEDILTSEIGIQQRYNGADNVVDGEQVDAENDFSNDDSMQDLAYLPEQIPTYDAALMETPIEATEDSDRESDSYSVSCARKRSANPEEWRRNKVKKLRNSGKSYKSNKGTIMHARQMKEACSQTCRLKCFENSVDIRTHIHRKFWDLGNINLQRDFISRHTNEVRPKYQNKTPGSNRKHNLQYKFRINDKDTQVCKTFFLNTLGVSDRYIYTTWKKTDDAGILEDDRRGKHVAHKKSDKVALEKIRQHIKMFPTIESHYLRAQTSRVFIDGSLTISEMYRLYKNKCISDGDICLKKHHYERIFNYEFNIGFFSPKKDQCSECEVYKNSNEEQRKSLQDNYDLHIKNKNQARESKKQDLELGNDVNQYSVCDYDLQAVLQTPCGDVSMFYYKRRLNVYNFTLFDNVSKQGYCFMWNESVAKRGSNEIASCVYYYMTNHAISKNLIFFSDNCAGQNKNKFIASMYLYVVTNVSHIESITHKFLITGHTQNAGDNMHSLIERQKKRVLKSGPIYVPTEWATVVKCSKKSGLPYIVREMETKDFIDFKHVSFLLGNNYKIDQNKENVKWADIKILQCRKDSPHIIFFKYNYDDELWNSFNLKKSSRTTHNIREVLLKPAYKEQPKIQMAKKKDLVYLCHSSMIPEAYHSFYENILAQDDQEEDNN
ncbi:uncharacterized protein [Diabrotica undecimpunctata]|uniref:uncharacterized protein n=2 Tax=Diabrotica undecimpunctata TaxID=50387 RepID=UPI003B641AD0